MVVEKQQDTITRGAAHGQQVIADAGGFLLQSAICPYRIVMQNGERNARLIIKTPDAKILRLRDAIHPDEANTPVKRVCYIAQLAVAGEADPDEAKRLGAAGPGVVESQYTAEKMVEGDIRVYGEVLGR